MSFVAFLILFPLIPAMLMLLCKSPALRKGIIILSAAVIAIASINLAFTAPKNAAQYFENSLHFLGYILLAGEILLAIALLYMCRKLTVRKYWIPLLVVIQTGIILWAELSGKIPES
ncbi:MAG: hypothetical protein NT118_02085, partial [Lentisphaerae bacterium]|nr:hypothetical protein [Lentisphaerota bacterium]